MLVNEIFYSFQGEGMYVGTPCIFLRLSGCNFHCSFCDTDNDIRKQIKVHNVSDVIKFLMEKHKTNLLVITGGEPLLQYDTLKKLINSLDCQIQIETNGSIIKPIIQNIDYVVSPKNNEELLFDFYKDYDNVHFKFIIKNQQDIDMIKKLQEEHNYTKTIWLQPLFQKDKEMTQLILDNNLQNIKISGQLHKYLNQR